MDTKAKKDIAKYFNLENQQYVLIEGYSHKDLTKKVKDYVKKNGKVTKTKV